MRVKKLFCVMAAMASAASANCAHAAVTVFSDSFETYSASQVPWNGSGSWTTGNSVDLVKSGDYFLTCAGGTGNCVDLTGNRPGSISRSIFLTAGKYVLSFVATGNQLDSRGGPRPETGITATIAGLTLDTGKLANNSTVFQNFSGGFTAASTGNYLLTFAQQPGGDTFRGSILDNVSISAAPEPASWMMMIAGIGMVGAALRRRRRLAFAA